MIVLISLNKLILLLSKMISQHKNLSVKSEIKIRKEKKISSLFSNKKSFEFLFIFIEQKISSHERCHTKKVTDCLVKKLRNNITVTPKSFVFYFNSTILEPIFFQFKSPQSKFCVKITLFILNFKVNNVPVNWH
jgi:hypothetical protein